MKKALIGVPVCLGLLLGHGCGDDGASSAGGDFCHRWCRACALCGAQQVQEGDCLDSGGPYCRSICRQALASPAAGCSAALDRYLERLDAVIASPDWLACKITIDRDNPFDRGACPELPP